MMDWQARLKQVNAYFSQLNDAEKYGWLAVGIGFLCIVSGIVLLFL